MPFLKWIVILIWCFESFSFGAECLRATGADVGIGLYFISAASLGSMAIYHLWPERRERI
jgi:hypothetical protein